MQNEAIEKYKQKEKATVGDYNTYSDKWIIQNVEPLFNEGVRQNHNSGYFLHTIGSTFSTFGINYGKLGRGNNSDVSGKVRDLPRSTESTGGTFELPKSNSECDDGM